MYRSIIIFLVVLFPISALAEGETLSRRDGFLLLWEGIQRPAYETSYESFPDVQEGEEGYKEITYAKRRKFFDDETTFRPDSPLVLEDALLWLFRTRNVDELPDMERKDIERFLVKYPIEETEFDLNQKVTREELMKLQQELDRLLTEEVHEVSFYSDNFHGDGTAFGETFDMYDFTAAHRSFPHNTLVKVTNVENEKSVIVRINDRGPYVDGRDMDLSYAAFHEIADHASGVLHARFERLGDQELVDQCSDEPRTYQKRITRNVRFHRGIPHILTLGEELYIAANTWFVVRGIHYPDGTMMQVQDWVGAEETFQFKPSIEGEYQLIVGDKNGRQRTFKMMVQDCNGKSEE